ncbi:MAG: CapA family protein [Treponema sp.]|jgi:poly-gamma-glutamate synthesis protein (capsule biosynthesis protein)|nr:CapA family protein [Treponema sp.]
MAIILFTGVCFSEQLEAPLRPPHVLAGPEAPDELTLIAVGDNLYHDVMVQPYSTNADFDFAPNYEFVKPLVQAADIAFVNQETMLGGTPFELSGYPAFNSPQEVGEALIKVGFDVINQANNHSMDKGARLVRATMDFWDKHPEVQYLGIFRSQEARAAKRIIERKTMKIGFLSYTYGLNGIPLPKDQPYLVALIDTDVMAKEIDALRPLCDYLVVSMHWGNEGDARVSAAQERLSRFLADHQVDLIIGHHPHVLQPVATLPRRGGGTTHCFYSLGNFLSAQIPNSAMLGGMMYLKLRKSATGITVVESGVLPLVTHFERGFAKIRVYPLYAYSNELAQKHRRNASGNEISMAYFNRTAQTILGAALLTRNPFTPQP